MGGKLEGIFEKGGRGVIGTANLSGEVNLAVYAVPEIVDEETVCFGMTEGATHRNLKENPNASYLFIEGGKGYRGARIKLVLTGIEDKGEMLRRKKERLAESVGQKEADSLKYVACFRVAEVKPLI